MLKSSIQHNLESPAPQGGSGAAGGPVRAPCRRQNRPAQGPPGEIEAQLEEGRAALAPRAGRRRGRTFGGQPGEGAGGAAQPGRPGHRPEAPRPRPCCPPWPPPPRRSWTGTGPSAGRPTSWRTGWRRPKRRPGPPSAGTTTQVEERDAVKNVISGLPAAHGQPQNSGPDPGRHMKLQMEENAPHSRISSSPRWRRTRATPGR